jgi:hypothetical protein
MPLGLMAQEQLVPLHSNHKVMAEAKKMQANHSFKRATATNMDTLPFLDDFSKPGPYPDSSKWIDKKVYVNYGLPVCPHTLGVATFDGLDSIGKPYYPNNSPFASAKCDKLTSKPITWKNGIKPPFNLGDSIYFSFYYQGGTLGGRDSKGNSQLSYYPRTADTLLLQFRIAGDTTWNTIWYHLGYAPVADTDTTFHMVMIPFDTGKYIHSMATLLKYMNDGFQFRFLAYSCGTGDVDHWSIDEVYLNAIRGYTDTTQNDIAFAYEAPPLLTNYSMEPWEQYKPGDLVSTMHLFERNNNASITVSPLNTINTTYN